MVRVERPIDGPPSFPHSHGSKSYVETGRLAFAEGDKVVYPHHGAAVVECLVERDILGGRRTYLRLRLSHGLTITVPVDSAEQVGLRAVSSRKDVDGVFDLLRQKEGAMPELWPRRFKSNVAKLTSGDIYQGAEVVRDLSLMDRRRGISAGERTLLSKARELLISELTITLDSTEQSATDMVDAVLAESR